MSQNLSADLSADSFADLSSGSLPSSSPDSPQPVPTASSQTKAQTVLLVEDDPTNVRVFSKILTKRAGLTVRHTENVEEVLQITQAKEADLILMDVSLSHSMYQGKSVDGIRLTQMLKENPDTAHLPVILVTAHAMDGDRENFLNKSGADDYISKPVIDHEAFVKQICALLPTV